MKQTPIKSQDRIPIKTFRKAVETQVRVDLTGFIDTPEGIPIRRLTERLIFGIELPLILPRSLASALRSAELEVDRRLTAETRTAREWIQLMQEHTKPGHTRAWVASIIWWHFMVEKDKGWSSAEWAELIKDYDRKIAAPPLFEPDANASEEDNQWAAEQLYRVHKKILRDETAKCEAVLDKLNLPARLSKVSGEEYKKVEAKIVAAVMALKKKLATVKFANSKEGSEPNPIQSQPVAAAA